MDAYTNLLAVQAALKAALIANAPAKTAVDLGAPATLQKKHIWIAGGVNGTPDYDLSNGVESGQVVTLTVNGFVQAGEDYTALSTRLKELWDAVTTAVEAIAPAHADHAAYGRWLVDEGISADMTLKQLWFSREVILTRWL